MSILRAESAPVTQNDSAEIKEDVDSFILASEHLDAFNLGALSVAVKGSGVPSFVQNKKLLAQYEKASGINFGGRATFEFTLWGYDTAQLHCVLLLPTEMKQHINEAGDIEPQYEHRLVDAKHNFLGDFVFPALDAMPAASMTSMANGCPLPRHDSVSARIYSAEYDTFLRCYAEQASSSKTKRRSSPEHFFYMAGHALKARAEDVHDLIQKYIRRPERMQLIQLHFAITFMADAHSGGPIVCDNNNELLRSYKPNKFHQWLIKDSFCSANLPEGATFEGPHGINIALYAVFDGFRGVQGCEDFASKCRTMLSTYEKHLKYLRLHHCTRVEVVCNFRDPQEALSSLRTSDQVFDKIRQWIFTNQILVRYQDAMRWQSRLDRAERLLREVKALCLNRGVLDFDELRRAAVSATELQFFLSGSTFKLGCGYAALKKCLSGGTIGLSLQGRDIITAETPVVLDVDLFAKGYLPMLLTRSSPNVCMVLEAIVRKQQSIEFLIHSEDALSKVGLYVNGLAAYAFHFYGPDIDPTSSATAPKFKMAYYEPRAGNSTIAAVVSRGAVRSAVTSPPTALGQLFKAALRVTDLDLHSEDRIEDIEIFPMFLIDGIVSHRLLWAKVVESPTAITAHYLTSLPIRNMFILLSQQSLNHFPKYSSNIINYINNKFSKDANILLSILSVNLRLSLT